MHKSEFGEILFYSCFINILISMILWGVGITLFNNILLMLGVAIFSLSLGGMIIGSELTQYGVRYTKKKGVGK